MVKFPFRKKPWEKVACTFVVQESLPTGAGYDIITEPSGEIPTKLEVSELFKPGRRYRVMARAVEADEKAKIKAGTLVGVVWKHYESLPGGIIVKEKPQPRAERKTTLTDPSDAIEKWVGGFEKQFKTVKTFSEAICNLGEAYANIVGPREGPAAAGPEWTASPLDFEGKPPWMFHPYIVHTLAEEAKGVLAYAADRLEGIMGKGPAPPPGEEEEEEELRLPSLLEEAAAEEAVEAPIEEVIKEEAEVPAEEAAEVPVEAPSEEVETIPSLLEEELPCAQCGRTDVPLLLNGLCEKCVKKTRETAPEEGKQNE